MSVLITRTARLVPYAKRPKQVPSYVTAVAFEPAADEPAAALGSLFVVIEVILGGRASEEVAGLVMNALSDHYFAEPESGNDALRRFEQAVKATNHALAEYVNQGNASWIGKMSAVAAVQTGDELHLTQTGSAEAYLYRGKATTRITAAEGGRPTAPSKTFGSIASGQLEAGDHLLLATPALVHQIALSRLHKIVAESTPNTAIAEITDLLRDGQPERIAALVIELTTPEQAALQVRSEEPSEIHLGAPESALEAAKLAAQPLAQATVASTRKVGAGAKTGWQRAQPHVQRAGYKTAGWLRQLLASRKGVQRALIGAAVVAVLIIGFVLHHASDVRASKLFDRFNNDYSQYLAADELAKNGNKSDAAIRLNQLSTEVASLAKAQGQGGLNRKIKSAATSGAPTSVAELNSLIGSRLDSLDSLKKVSAVTVAALPKGAKPVHLETLAGKSYVFDSAHNSAIYVVNLSTKVVHTSSADTSKLGKVVATTLSSAGDGIYILTDTPAVWFYSLDNDSLTPQTINQGQWEAGTGIASYGTNLYILSNGVVYKHAKTLAGYSPKAEYITTSQSTSVASASALAVDGNVYLVDSGGLQLFLAGVLKATAEVPASLGHASVLRSFAGGNWLVAADATTGRIGFWDDRNSLSYSRQYALTGTKTVVDATYDDATKTGYALADGKLVSFGAN